MGTANIALLACAGVAILLILLNIPLYQGKIKRNQWYGFRTARTLESDEIWYPANREAGLNFIIASIITLLVAVVLFFLQSLISESALVIAIVVVSMVSIIGAVVKSFIFLSKLP